MYVETIVSTYATNNENMRIHEKPLHHRSVMLSASIPDELKNTLQAQDLFPVIQLFAKHILMAGGRLIIGGHPTVRPLVHRTALAVEHADDAIQLYQLRHFEHDAPAESRDTCVFPMIHWVEGELQEGLTAMRLAMSQAADAAIFIGGKTQNFFGAKPGIRDEYEQFLRQHPHAAR